MKTKKRIYNIAVTLIFVTYFIVVYRYFFAEINVHYANLILSQKPLQAWAHARHGVTLNPYEQNYQLTYLKSHVIAKYGDTGTHEKLITSLIEREPRDTVIRRELIRLRYFLAFEELTGTRPANEDALERARKYYTHLKTIYPTDVGVLIAIAEYEKKSGFITDYMQTKETITKLRGDITQWHPVLQDSY